MKTIFLVSVSILATFVGCSPVPYSVIWQVRPGDDLHIYRCPYETPFSELRDAGETLPVIYWINCDKYTWNAFLHVPLK